ncbi:hypothetical protein CHISP_0340 [Chitinispirillum alkaliphilum]|nr:hypothetical protein CHISP_0340 [Chitinispirillum alkaliphilum]
MPKKSIVISAIFILFASLHPAWSAPPPFWADEITEGLNRRKEFTNSMGITEQELFSIQNWNSAKKNSARNRLLTISPRYNPWIEFTRGAINIDNHKASQPHFQRAINSSINDPGTLWLLCIEFMRHNQMERAQQCLNNLEKLMISSNATAAPFLSRKLAYKGYRLEADGNKKMANMAYEWARVFDRNQLRAPLRQAFTSFPRLIDTFSYLRDATVISLRSWRIQHSIIFSVYKWLYTAVVIFIFSIMLAFLIKYLHSAIHFLDEKLFSAAPYRARHILSTIVIFSFLSFGIIPFFWIISFLLCRYLKQNEKKLLFVICLLVAFHPLNNWIRASFLQSIKSTGTPVVFSRISTEGFSAELHNQALRLTRENPSDHLAMLSAAISNGKRNNLSAASQHIASAINKAPNDPLTLLTAGNHKFLNRKYDEAIGFYSKHIDISKSSFQAQFNLAQSYLEKMETVKGTEVIDDVPRRYSKRLNSFINLNDLHFAGNWPVHRKIMQPEISAGYFWTKLFHTHGIQKALSNNSDFKTFTLAYFLFSLGLVILLFVLDRFRWESNRVKKIFDCKLCGRITCKKCRAGILCKKCQMTIGDIRKGAAFDTAKLAIVNKSKKRKSIIRYTVSMFVPGIQNLLQSDCKFLAVLKIFISCTLLSLLYHLVNLYLSNTFILTGIISVLITGLLLFNLYHIITNGQKLVPVLLKDKEK